MMDAMHQEEKEEGKEVAPPAIPHTLSLASHLMTNSIAYPDADEHTHHADEHMHHTAPDADDPTYHAVPPPVTLRPNAQPTIDTLASSAAVPRGLEEHPPHSSTSPSTPVKPQVTRVYQRTALLQQQDPQPLLLEQQQQQLPLSASQEQQQLSPPAQLLPPQSQQQQQLSPPQSQQQQQLDATATQPSANCTLSTPSLPVTVKQEQQQLQQEPQQEPPQEPLQQPPLQQLVEKQDLPSYLRHMQEDVTLARWRQHSKQMFILSDAGKPIFTRYGNENDLNTMMGFFLAIVSFVQDNGDTIRTIVAGNLRFVFVVKGSLYLVAVARTREPASDLAMQLEYLYAQITFILTETIQEYLRRKKSFDLRNLLGGTDNVLHALIHSMSSGVSFSFHSLRCLRLPRSIRTAIGDLLLKHRASKSIYTLLIAGKNLVQLVRSKNYTMHTEDMLLLINFVSSSVSMRSSETWTPICIPGINPNAYAYAYIDFLEKDLCLVMICTNQDQFFECSAAKQAILQSMRQMQIIDALNTAIHVPSVNSNDIKVMSSAFEPPYNAYKERKRICRVYKNVREELRHSKSNNKIYFHSSNRENVLGWISATCELYAAFSVTASKATAIAACESIKAWIKREEEDIFVPLFKTY